MTTLPLSCFEISPLKKSHRIEAESLTFPLYRPLLTEVLEGTQDLVALVLLLADRPVGLALARIDHVVLPDEKAQLSIATLLSIAILSQRRRCGLGSRLLLALQDHLSAMNIARLEAVWLTSSKDYVAFEALLATHNWSQPRLRTYFGKGFARDAFVLPWVSMMRRLKSGSVILPWVDVKEDQRHAIQRGLVDGSIPQELSPFYREDDIEPVTSLTFFHDHQLAGWLINYPLGEDSVAYARQFVRQPFAAMGRGMTLVAHALERHCNHDHLITQRPYASVDIPLSFPRMLSAFNKYISPAGQTFFESMTAFRDLTKVNPAVSLFEIAKVQGQDSVARTMAS